MVDDLGLNKTVGRKPLSHESDKLYTFKSIGKDDAVIEFGIDKSQHGQVGSELDFWGDLIEGEAEKAGEFWKHYFTHKSQHLPDDVAVSWQYLRSSGFNQPVRRMEFNKLGAVTVTTYVATMGDSLHISFRVFILAKISQVKVALTVLLILGMTNLFNGDGGFTDFGFSTVMAIVLVIAYALHRNITSGTGDWFEPWRDPVRLIYHDEAVALSKVVHNAMMMAADQVGIDRKKLEPRVPFYQQRTKPRI
jgi:hypothetical protein